MADTYDFITTRFDKSWMLEGMVEGLKCSLSPDQLASRSDEDLLKMVDGHIDSVEKNFGDDQVTLVARTAAGDNAGYVWTVMFPNDMTGDAKVSS